MCARGSCGGVRTFGVELRTAFLRHRVGPVTAGEHMGAVAQHDQPRGMLLATVPVKDASKIQAVFAAEDFFDASFAIVEELNTVLASNHLGRHATPSIDSILIITNLSAWPTTPTDGI